MTAILSISQLTKTYAGGFQALKGVDLEVEEGEILALLGPNGAGKTTLISTVCGLSRVTSGKVVVGGHDIAHDFRAARGLIGLVPQEIALSPFSTVMNELRFSRGLHGLRPDDAHLRGLLRDLSLETKAGVPTMALSGGMKRRVHIAKALAHGPKLLFLDEPSAGVDVELRKGMWATVDKLRAQGVTVILTTHYIEEAEAMADRIAVINDGQILLVERKDALMARLGKKALRVDLADPVAKLPDSLDQWDLQRAEDGMSLTYTYDISAARSGITRLLNDLAAAGLVVRDVETKQSSLEEIFVGLVAGDKP